MDMLNINKDIWGVLCAGSDVSGEAQILHLPTIVENAKGETIVRGYHGTSLSRKVEVEFSIDFLLDIVATAVPIEVVEEHAIIPLPCIARNRTAVVLFGNEKWLPTRSPALTPLFGNVFAGVIKAGDDSVLIMAKACHPLV